MISERNEALDTRSQYFLQLTVPTGLEVQMETDLPPLPPYSQAE